MKRIVELSENDYQALKEDGVHNHLALADEIIAHSEPYEEKPQGDLISRDSLKKALHNFFDGKVIDDPTYILRDVFCYIDNAPAIEPDEIQAIMKDYLVYRCEPQSPKGKWIKEDDEHLKGWYRCSECGRRVEDLTDDIKIHAGCEDYTIADLYPYCHCGAKMEVEEE